LDAREKEAGSHFGNNHGRERWTALRDFVGLNADAPMAAGGILAVGEVYLKRRSGRAIAMGAHHMYKV
jgi:hypothetical protein